jgi:hypothetical protein
MPAPKAISPNEKEWIKQYIQEAYDITVVDTFDCQVLSEAIAKKNGTKISYSTFRRLFDLVPNNNTKSRFILNALAVAVGFKNWELFKLHVAGFDTNVINQNIQVYSRQLPNSSALLLETIKKLPIITWMGGYQLQSCVALAIEHQDFDLLKEVVQIPFDVDNQNVYEHLVIGFQSLYFQSVKNNDAVIEFVRTNIESSILLQKCLLQAYVDEKYLDSFLGKWFDAIEENTLPDLLLFKNLLLCQKSFNINEVDKAKTYFYVALKLSMQNQLEIHPILKARIGVWNLVLNKDKQSIATYYNSLSCPFDKADFAVIASRLLWTYYDELATISFLEHITLKEFPAVKDFFQKGRHNLLLLTLAIHYYLKQEHQQSKEYFNLFNSNTLGYDIVNVDFYEKWIQKLEQKKP